MPRSRKTEPKPGLRRDTTLVIGVIAGVVFVVALLFLFMRPKETVVPADTNTTVDTSQVTITTDDGVALAATIKYPVRNVLSPAVILLHQYGQDRHQWDPYLQGFLDAGVVVLSYDMRGFGTSRLAAIPTDLQTHLDSLPNDLPAVIAYLRAQPSIDQDKISIIGASIGADVAYVGIGSGLGLYRAGMLSPVVRGTALDGHLVKDFAPRGVIAIASEAEQDEAETFMAKVKDPKRTTIVEGNDHGLELLSDPTHLESLITWIKS